MQLIPWEGQRERVFLDRYALKDLSGNPIETQPKEMWNRVAEFIGSTSNEKSIFSDILTDFVFVPSGRILCKDRTLYNCFVIGIEKDSRIEIMNAISRMIEITARGGGVGINWSILRPKGTHIRGVNGRSSGPLSWMRGADSLADSIQQGGSRTAALMWMLHDWHPDVLSFCRLGDKFMRANFSVCISDKFMEAVKADGLWQLEFPMTESPFYDFEWSGDLEEWKSAGFPTRVHQQIRARELWEMMAHSTHQIGSPGVSFIERCNKMSNASYLREGRITCTNPCGEQALPSFGCCNLGAVNLLALFSDGKINMRLLELTVRFAVRFLDRVIDVTDPIIPEIDEQQRLFRRVGLGTMGLADVLLLSKIRYGSEESLKFIDKIFSFIRDAAFKASIELAEEKGLAKGFDAEKFLGGGFASTLPSHLRQLIRRKGIRNMSILTQAPTGTTSILAGASSGIEPIFDSDCVRTDATGVSHMVHPLFRGEGGDHLVTAKDLTVEEHLSVQSQVQKYFDAAISKTINLPEDSGVDEIMRAYELAYDLGCKGVTVYRQNSLDGVLKPYCESCNI